MKQFLAWLFVLAMFSANVFGEAPSGRIAPQEDMTDVIDIVDETMVPVTAEMLLEGYYPAEVDSSSSMFKVTGCFISVSNGMISAKLYMKSQSYSYMYAGTAEEAAAADRSALVMLEQDEDGYYFILPVEALDAGYTCAAYSARKEEWYPRLLVFRADSLPLEAFKTEYLTTPASLSLADGDYECEAKLSGAGKSAVASPVRLHAESAKCTAHIVFTTKKIDYILVGGEKYLPVSVEDGAAFDIPVSVFDRNIAVTVDSTAIKPATEVPYSIIFYSESITAVQAEG